MAEPLNDATSSIESTNPTTPPTGYASDSPQAKEALNRINEARNISTSGLGYTVKSAIMGGGAGSKASEGALNPVSAFMQGAAAGLQIPSMLANQKREQLQSAMDAAPLSVSFPEIAERYPHLASFPTKLAVQTIQSIAVDTARQVKASELRMKEDILDEVSAAPYAKMANQAYGIDSITPAELVGMRREDVDNFIKFKSAAGSQADVTKLVSEPWEQADPSFTAAYPVIGEGKRRNPYYNMPTKILDKVKSANTLQASKELDKSVKTMESLENVKNSLSKAEAILNAGLETGPITGNFPGRKLGKDAQEFDQIASTILPSMRQGMPGAVSDRDMAIFKDANFGLGKDEGINKRIISQQKAIVDRIGEKAQALANWITVYGDASGFESEWSKHTTKNPLFDLKGNVLGKESVAPSGIPEGATGKAKDGTPVVRKGGKWVAQ